MEKKLKQLFDYQRFDPSPRLANLIRKTESRQKRKLTDDELLYVVAAGDTDKLKAEKITKDDISAR